MYPWLLLYIELGHHIPIHSQNTYMQYDNMQCDNMQCDNMQCDNTEYMQCDNILNTRMH